METLNCQPGICFICKRLLLFLFAAGPFLYAQNAPESSSYAVKTQEGFTIHQIIAFPAVPNTLYYEVEIEQITAAGPAPIEKLQTNENKFEVSLRAGSYRYRITSYSNGNRLEGQSGWQDFVIFPAIQPEAEAYQPFYGLYYETAKNTGSITVYGRDFSAESEFALVRSKKDAEFAGVPLENIKNAIIPDQIIVSENQALLIFSRSALKRGNYDIFIRNPGGMFTLLGEVRAGYKEDSDFTLSFGYSPTFAFFDIENAWYETPDSTGKWVWKDKNLDRFNPLGFYIRFALIPIKTRFGNFGIEAQLDFITDNYTKDKKEQSTGFSGSFMDSLKFGTINLLYQFPQTERWQHNIRVGVGAGESYHKELVNSFYEGAEAYIYIDAGYSAQFFLWKNLYAEAGIDLLFARGISGSHTHFMIRPGLGLGWQMGRWAEYAEVAEGAKKEKDYSVPVTDKPRPEQLISLGWAPMVSLAGIDRYGYHKGTPPVKGEQFTGSFNPMGISIRYAYIPYRWGNNKLGFEFELTVLEHKNRGLIDNTLVRAVDLFSDVMFGIRYQRVLDERWQINGRAGIGAVNTYAYANRSDPNDPPVWEIPEGPGFGFKFGASAQFFFWRGVYIEGGLDLIVTNARQDNEKGVSSNARLSLKPTIAIGYQFKRNNETGLRLPGTGLPGSAK